MLPYPHLSLLSGGAPVLGLEQDVDPVEDDVLEAASEVLLVAEKDLVEVSHAAHKDAKVDIEFVESARQLGPEQ